MYISLQVNCPLFLSDFHETSFSKNTQILIFMKFRPVGYEMFHASGRTDRNDEANSHFPQFRSRTGTLTLRIYTTPWRRIWGVEIKFHAFSSSVNSHSHRFTYSHYQGGRLVPQSTWTYRQKRNFHTSVQNRTPVLYDFDGNSLIGYSARYSLRWSGISTISWLIS